MTKRKQEVLSAITHYRKDKGYSPSYSELADLIGVTSLSTVHKHVESLVAIGKLHRCARNIARTIEVVDCCPHCGGKVAA